MAKAKSKQTVDTLAFKDAEIARDSITKKAKKEIAALYQKWSKEIGQKAITYSHSPNASAPVKVMQLTDLQNMLEATSRQVMHEVNNNIQANMYIMSDKVVKTNTKWLKSLGMIPAVGGQALSMAFSHVPDNVVRNLITGQVYGTGWSLSKSIWSDNQDTMSKLYEIVGGGIAQNKSVYDIAKELERYVSPNAAKQWNLTMADGKKIYPKQVDYNAQRLVRTLTQHSYQQTFNAVIKYNPFVQKVIWVANGSRVCPICLARNGRLYTKGEEPLDHPNGMCFTRVILNREAMTDRLANWVNTPRGTDKDLDKFIEVIKVRHNQFAK